MKKDCPNGRRCQSVPGGGKKNLGLLGVRTVRGAAGRFGFDH